MEDKKKVDVVIPTYKPGKKFSRLLKMLQRQTWPVGKIIVMNTEKSFWNEHGFEGIKNLEVHHLTKEEFDHGDTRNRGMRFSRADIVVFMTDDAVPADERLIEELVKAFEQRGPEGEAVIMAYARQLPDKDCPLAERYIVQQETFFAMFQYVVDNLLIQFCTEGNGRQGLSFTASEDSRAED